MNSFEEWEAAYRELVGAYFPEQAKDRTQINWQLDFQLTHGLPTATVNTKIDRLVRTKRDTRRDDLEDFYLTFLTKGKVGIHHCGKEELLVPGAFFLGDASQPVDMNIDGMETGAVTLNIPRSLLLCERGYAPTAGSQIDARNPLFASLKNLILGGENLDQESVRPEFLLDLVGMAFGENPSVASAGRFRNDRDRVEFVTQVIDQNLTDCDFSIDHLAILVGRSRRQIQRDLKNAGTSFTKLLQDRRLRHFVAAGLHAARLEQHLPIEQLVYMSGFGDRSHFNRVFREKHDVAPKEYLLERI